MRFWCLVLIAAVAVNSLVTTINARSTSNTVIEPFNMLLPPLADKTEDVAAAKTSSTKSSSATATTVAPISKTKTTLKPLTNDVNNVAVPELSIEALLPPLFEAKTEKAENDNKQQTDTTAVETTTLRTTTTAATTTTTARTTTSTTARTTRAPKTTPVTTSSAAVQPELSLDALVPPLEVELVDATTANPDEAKSTKKSYYQQQKQHLKNLSSTNDASSTQLQENETSPQNIEEPPVEPVTNFKSNTLPKHIVSNIEALAKQQVIKQFSERNRKADSAYRPAFNNYSFDLYLGFTTPRPPKQGLPTITPFPHRLGR